MSNRFHNNPPLRYGMIGGGITSQIGDSHRAALRRDSYFQLVAGAFDIDKERGQQYGKSLGLKSDRTQPTSIMRRDNHILRPTIFRKRFQPFNIGRPPTTLHVLTVALQLATTTYE